MKDYVILKATESNYSCHRIGDWENTGFQLFNSGILYVSVNSNINIVDCRTFIDESDLVKIKESIATFNKMPPKKLSCFDCCDGTGWRFTSYDEDNNICGKSHGYIYGIDVLEQMARILNNYIPKYSIHGYEDMDSMELLQESEKNTPKSYYGIEEEEE